MSQHDCEANKKQIDQSSTEVFRFPTREELRQAKEQKQAKVAEQNKSDVTNYKDEDLSGCLSGCLSGSLKAQPKTVKQPEAIVTYKDEDLSGCLSGNLKSQTTKSNTSQRDRFVPTQRNVKTGEITAIERDDLSAAIDSLNEENSGWLYFN